MSAALATPPTSSRRPTPALPGQPVATAGGLFRLPGVVLFAAGQHTDMHGRTREYGPDYLSAVARNFAELRHAADPHVEPPAVLGHEVSQDRLAALLADDAAYQAAVASDRGPTPGGGPSRTDEPAAGWIENVRFDQTTGQLVGDLERVPPTIANMIRAGQLRFPSVEFKETLKRPDGSDVGPALFRVALLGGTPPACKSVPPLGQSHFADAPPGVLIFADGVTSMAAATATPSADSFNLLLQNSYPDLPPDLFGTLTPEQQDILAKAAVGPAADPNAADPNAPTYADGGVPPGFDKAACIDRIVAAEKPADEPARRAELEAMTDAELYALEQKLAGAAPGATNMSDQAAAKAVADVKAFADQQVARIDAHAAARAKELDRQAAAIKRTNDAAVATQKARDDALWAETVRAFCDEQSQIPLPNGRIGSRIPPAELDPADPTNLRVELTAIGADEVLAFADADGTAKTKSKRELALERIRKRPVRSFGDRIAHGQGQDAADAARAERLRKDALDLYKSTRRTTNVPLGELFGQVPGRHSR